MDVNGRRIKRAFSGVLCCLALVLALAGCAGGDDAPDVVIDLLVSPDPPRVGPAAIVMALTDADGQPITGAALELEATMTHPGMVPVFAEVTEPTAGQYVATLQFTMGGDWIIIVSGKLPDGRALEREIDLPGVQVK